MCVALLQAGCGDNDTDPPSTDTGTTIPDAGVTGDGGGGNDMRLYTCKNPGLACNAHDPCAINPICGKDKLCRPSFYQNCSDDLDCTNDSCAGSGMCKNEPKTGWCALLVKEKGATKTVEKCLKSGYVNPQDPCQGCNPSVSNRKWSARTGGSCDDGNACTQNDVCQAGVCKGTYFGNKCSDGLECTDDVCDGKGGCSHKLKSGTCLISGKCYKSGAADANGCSVCDPTKSATAWSARANVCKVSSQCYGKGTYDNGGCGVCDPAKNKSGWVAAPGRCLIKGSCYKSGETDGTGCGSCDPTKSTSAFTPVANRCLINGVCKKDNDKSPSGCGVCKSSTSGRFWTPVSTAKTTTYGFESGLGSVKVSAAVGSVGWQVDKTRKHGGTSSLYYGNPTKGSYDNGKANSGTVTLPSVSLPSGQDAALHFWVYLDVEAAKTHDVLSVKVNGSQAWAKNPSTMPPARYRRWTGVEVDLSSYAGSSVTVTFTFNTKDDWANSSEGVYLDDITVLTSCGGTPAT